MLKAVLYLVRRNNSNNNDSIPHLLADAVIWACRDAIHTVYVYVEVAKSRKDLKKKRLSLVPPPVLHSITASTIDFIGKQLK
jgi:hypothetical protein